MTIAESTSAYEKWLRTFLVLNQADLELKHRDMAQDPFSFFRATFYAWMTAWPDLCAELTRAPEVLAIGDIHVENFGTWRDSEGRLIWGVNDFDEAYPLPYTADLVRLATSACLAIDTGRLRVTHQLACQALLDGYRDSLEHGGSAAVLAERHSWLRDAATGSLRDPVRFWGKLTSKSAEVLAGKIAPKIKARLLKQLPKTARDIRYFHRVSGLGSLGRQRIVVTADYEGGLIAREAKALAPSACVFATGKKSKTVYYNQILSRAVRCADPFVKEQGGWIYRRLAPDCSRIELASLRKQRDEVRLLREMGWEVANIHLGSRKAVAGIKKDLAKRKGPWLRNSAEAMLRWVKLEWKALGGWEVKSEKR